LLFKSLIVHLSLYVVCRYFCLWTAGDVKQCWFLCFVAVCLFLLPTQL